MTSDFHKYINYIKLQNTISILTDSQKYELCLGRRQTAPHVFLYFSHFSLTASTRRTGPVLSKKQGRLFIRKYIYHCPGQFVTRSYKASKSAAPSHFILFYFLPPPIETSSRHKFYFTNDQKLLGYTHAHFKQSGSFCLCA